MHGNYRALTRKYRPHTFEDIVSQEHVSNTLKNAIKQNRLSHAYMFCGPRGVGKTTMARVLARVVNEIDTDVDGESLSQTLNIVEMDAASNRKIDDVRSLKEVIRVPPQNGKYKIFIIDEVHMLTKEAFNALLKTLEEPPAHAIFIFATTEPHKVLPTILSRVQRFDFKRISVGDIVQRLRKIADKEQITIDEESLHVIAKRADGALRDALGLMDQAIAFCGTSIDYNELLRALNVVDKEHLFSFVSAVHKRNSHKGLTLISELLQAGTDIQEFLVSLTEHFRNLYVANNEKRIGLLEATEETRKQYVEQSSQFTEDDLMRMLHLVSEAQVKIKEAQQPKVHFEILMLKLVHMHRSTELNKLMDELESLKKNSGNTVASVSADKVNDEPNEKTEEYTSNQVNEDSGGSQSSNSADTNNSSVDTDEASSKAQSGPDKEQTSTGAQSGEEEPDIFGKPSLNSSMGNQFHKENNGSDHSPPTEEQPGKVEIKSVDSVIEKWDEFLERLKTDAPRMLFYQMQRVDIKNLQGRELLISVDNEFGHRMVEENRMLISNLTKKEFGVKLQIRCDIERNKRKKKESLSPYERFKQLQQRDPHLKTLVELFGAELEY